MDDGWFRRLSISRAAGSRARARARARARQHRQAMPSRCVGRGRRAVGVHTTLDTMLDTMAAVRTYSNTHGRPDHLPSTRARLPRLARIASPAPARLRPQRVAIVLTTTTTTTSSSTTTTAHPALFTPDRHVRIYGRLQRARPTLPKKMPHLHPSKLPSPPSHTCTLAHSHTRTPTARLTCRCCPACVITQPSPHTWRSPSHQRLRIWFCSTNIAPFPIPTPLAALCHHATSAAPHNPPER
jgi:hypothetical protein